MSYFLQFWISIKWVVSSFFLDEKISLIASFLLVINVQSVRSQNKHFVFEGTVDYEKTVNMFAIIKNTLGNNPVKQKIFDQYKNTEDQFVKLFSSLDFKKDESLFIPLEDNTDKGSFFGVNLLVSQNKSVYQNFQSNSSITEWVMNQDKLKISSPLQKVEWKYTDEIRNIAGYDCRRANAIIRDSIYVVAFYAEEIPVPTGPESFHGLPGMILGLAIPSEHITWFATKVTEKNFTGKKLSLDAIGLISNEDYIKAVHKASESWTGEKSLFLKAYLN